MTDRDSAKTITGVIPACITPMFESGEIDYGSLEKQIAYLSGQDIGGLFLNGTSGEGAYLSAPEKAETIRVAKGMLRKDQLLFVACIKPSASQVIIEQNALAKLHPDFFVAVSPYYAKVSQDVIRQHFREIARAAPAPLIIYNIPQNTNNPLKLDTILDLAGTDNIAGIKDSSGDFIAYSRGVLSTGDEPFAWIQGEDFLEAASYLIGGNAVVTGLGNVCLEPYIEMYRAAQQGCRMSVLEAQRKVNALYGIVESIPGSGIAAIKTACTLLARSNPWTRVPAPGVSEEELRKVKDLLEALDLI